MRIIAGEKKGHKLMTLSGDSTRPTTDYVKEAIFSILFDCEDMRVLDLFSGSGSLGLEALSRGAKSLELVDISERAVRVINKNIDKLNYNTEAKVHKQKAESYLKATADKFDIILADPPYNKDYVNHLIETIMGANVLAEEGLVVIEHSTREKIKPEWERYLSKQKVYGDSTITILKVNEENDAANL